jgi:1,4-dihydroxy-2-naphthoate octaprenyltransferase
MMECMEVGLNSLRITQHHMYTLLNNVINFVKKMEAAKDSHLVEFQHLQNTKQEVVNAHSITMEFVLSLLLQFLTLTTMLRLVISSNQIEM